MTRNGFLSHPTLLYMNCTKRECHLEQLVNLSCPEVSSCLPVCFDSILNPIHFLLFHVILATELSFIARESRVVVLILK